MEQSLVQWFSTLGVGGAIAAFMFYFYRKDMKENADRLKELIDSDKTAQQSWKDVVVANTRAMTECTKMTEQVFKYLLDTHDLVKGVDKNLGLQVDQIK